MEWSGTDDFGPPLGIYVFSCGFEADSGVEASALMMQRHAKFNPRTLGNTSLALMMNERPGQRSAVLPGATYTTLRSMEFRILGLVCAAQSRHEATPLKTSANIF